MIITDISIQKNNKRFNIFLDGEFAFGISDELKFKYCLEIGKDINRDFIVNIIESEELKKAKDKSFKYLSYRQRSEKEIVDNLHKTGFDEKIITSTIQYLINEGFINDESFAENYIKDKKNLSKFGPLRIKNELKLKGIDERIIVEKLSELDDKEENYEIALDLAKKKMKGYINDPKEAKIRKLSSLLIRKGYDFDIVSKVINSLIDNR